MEVRDIHRTDGGEAEIEIIVRTRDDLPFPEPKKNEMTPQQLLGFGTRLIACFVAMHQTGKQHDLAEAMLGCAKALAGAALKDDAKKRNAELFDLRKPKDEGFGDWKEPE